MMHDFKMLIWLKLRHMRTKAVRWGYMTGVDILRDRGRVDRFYLVYILVFTVACAVVMWHALLDVSLPVISSMEATTAIAVLEGIPLVPLAVFLMTAVTYLRPTSMNISSADIVYIATSPLSLMTFVIINAGVSAGVGGIVTLLASFLILPGLEFASGVMLSVPYMAFGIACSVAVSIIVAATGAFALTVKWNDDTVLIQKLSRSAKLHEFDGLAQVDPMRYREMRRRTRMARRRPRLRLPEHEGARMIVSRACLSHLRQIEGLGDMLVWGSLTALLTQLMIGQHTVGFLLMGLIAVLAFWNSGRYLTQVFRDDCRNPLISDHLPYGRDKLLVFDSLPAISLSTFVSVVLILIFASGPSDLVWSLWLAVMINVVTVLSGGFDVIETDGRWRIGFESGLLAFLIVVGSLSLVGSPALLVGSAFVLTVVYGARLKAVS